MDLQPTGNDRVNFYGEQWPLKNRLRRTLPEGPELMAPIEHEFAMKTTNVFRRQGCCRDEVVTSSGEEPNGDRNKACNYTEIENLVRESSLKA